MFDEKKRKKQCEVIGKELSEDMLEDVSGGMYEGSDERWSDLLHRCSYCDKWLTEESYAPHMIYFHQVYGSDI